MVKRGVTKLILGQKADGAIDSEGSASDNDIRRRNVALLKEAEATFNVSTMLGIKFGEAKDAIVSRLIGLDAV
ncbi:hypothetical protein CCACVL1_27465 [Corchorus capsularis]|uniref:Uncharacterized protein n=1 Tax=Corchorus capsularis TaxID=210143 RepID=A0A1R3GA98_COCAP|nr:hypothetical protein CCACVL1_27465 [Corchorus capsularis]